MTPEAIWKDLNEGEGNIAIPYLRSEHRRKPNGSTAMGLGVALLWTRAYRDVWMHFGEANALPPGKRDSFFGLAGVALWCDGRRAEAIAQWREGLRAPYTDGAGGVGVALLLIYAAVIEPELLTFAAAKALLEKKLARRWASRWPGAIGRYVAGQIDGQELRACLYGQTARSPPHQHSDGSQVDPSLLALNRSFV